MTHHSSLLAHHSWLITPGSSLMAHHSSLKTHHSSLKTHHSSLMAHHSWLITHHSRLITHHSWLITHHSWLMSSSHYDSWLPSRLLAPLLTPGSPPDSWLLFYLILIYEGICSIIFCYREKPRGNSDRPFFTF